jgi:hypothetical protein
MGSRRLKAQIAALGVLLQRAYGHEHDDGGHRYLGTYCYHGDHDACKVVCKTCSSPCVCACHLPGFYRPLDIS